MDLVTVLTACALGFKAELFVPLRARDDCTASFGLGTAVARRNGSPTIDRWAAYIAKAAQRFGRPEAWVRAVMQAESRGAADANIAGWCNGSDADHARDICWTASAVRAWRECL